MSTHASFYRPAWLLLICALLAALVLPHAAHASEVENTRRLAAQGDAGAQFHLGWMYAAGLGVPRNHASAVRWYRLFAGQGVADAQFILGLMYFYGAGVSRNLVNAHMWLNLSAAQGNFNAAHAHERIAREMSPAQLAQAQRRARACLAANYRNC